MEIELIDEKDIKKAKEEKGKQFKEGEVMDKKICHYCKKSIIDNDYLGNEKIGFIHLKCLSSHINKNRYVSGKKFRWWAGAFKGYWSVKSRALVNSID